MSKRVLTAIYSAAHFFVDFACAFLIFRYIFGNNSSPEIFLIYNFCAFALQMPFGILLDKFGGGHRAAAAGCFLIFAAYIISGIRVPHSAFISAAAAGTGNSLFHVGGGVYILDEYGTSSGALGVFVSPGAIGLYLGTVSGKGTSLGAIVPIAFMLLFSILIVSSPYFLKLESKSGAMADDPFSFSASPRLIASALMFTAVVCIRSFGGFALGFSWKTTAAASLLAVAVTAGGKAAGGFTSDLIGSKMTAAISMSAAAVLYLLSDSMAAGIAAILLFNMSMPVTLRAAADIFSGARGFSFGLLTFALFLGYVPFYVTGGNIHISKGVMCLLCIASMLLLLAGFKIYEKKAVTKNEACNT